MTVQTGQKVPFLYWYRLRPARDCVEFFIDKDHFICQADESRNKK